MSTIKEWIPVGAFFLGIGLGAGLYAVYDTTTGAIWTCSCDDTQGEANWSSNCPQEVIDLYGNRCPHE